MTLCFYGKERPTLEHTYYVIVSDKDGEVVHDFEFKTSKELHPFHLKCQKKMYL